MVGSGRGVRNIGFQEVGFFVVKVPETGFGFRILGRGLRGLGLPGSKP